MTRKRAESQKVRLQKFLSDAGVASRRQSEEWILQGRVLVNDDVVDELPAFVDPQADKVIVDGTRVRIQPHEYFLVHKPKGVVCTNRDPAGRIRAVDLLPPTKGRPFVVGRLDAESTGLLLMTNDGELAERVTHPRYGVAKTYRAEVRGAAGDDLPQRMKKGVYLSDGKARASEVQVIHRSRQRSVLQITLREGRNRQVRRMLARLGHPVKTLKRIQIGPLSLKALPLGASRRLMPWELAALRKELAAAQPVRRPRRRSAKSARTARTARPRSPRAAAGPRPKEESTLRKRRIVS